MLPKWCLLKKMAFLQLSQLFFCATLSNVILSELMLKRNIQFVTLPCQDPVLANGRITRFDIKIQPPKDKVKNDSMEWESIPVNTSEADSSKITTLKEIHLADKETVRVHVTAINSVGKSPEALLGIREKAHGTYSWRL